MSGASTEESGPGRSFEVVSSNQLHRQSSDAVAECRSFEQVENGAPSTSPPYWDIDDDEDGGPKPSELYGKYTWKIDKFSQTNKRELRSNAFEVGGYKWYILIYPQGCDVCNHLSLFLCVANHDKLLPGWSHFAQFTIAVVNKDPKKSKYSDTLHRFWKKEHDWGWKKFMELSKVMDGFIDADTLIIKAQVQVIRERADRPFRCLDCQYRRELVRVYLSNVEQICRRFVEDRRTKLGKLIEEKAKWSSFCTFWLGMDQSSRRRMSRERTESILKVAVKHFFVEKEVTSTLVMDSLYSGLKALEGQTKGGKGKGKSMDAEELPNPVIGIDKDTFILVDDVLLLLERAAMEPLPPKDDKGPQNRTKDGVTGEEISKDSIERDERRLTELGRRTIEIFVLYHIYSKIDVAYQEAVALRRQEELIREEEAAWHAEIEQKPRRGLAEKKSKKKQAKQKKNNRKVKDKVRDEKLSSIVQDSMKEDFEIKEPLSAESEMVVEKIEALEDVSDVSDSVDCEPEVLPIDSEDRDTSPVNWDTDTSEVQPPTEACSSGLSVLSGVQNGTEGRSPSAVDDSSSTCSSDSVPCVGINVSHTGNLHKNQKYPARGTKHQSKPLSDNWAHEEASQSSEAARGAGHWIDASRSSKTAQTMSQAAVGSLKVNGADRRVEKEDRSGSMQKTLPAKANSELSSNGTASVMSPPRSPSKSIQYVDKKLELKANAAGDPVILKKSSSDGPKQGDRTARVANSAENAATSKPDISQKLATPKPAGPPATVGSEKLSMPPMTLVVSRPLSAPLIIPAAPRPAAVSTAQTAPAPALARSASATGRLAPEPSISTSPRSFVPQSYRNAIIGNNVPTTSSAYGQSYSMVNASYPQTPRPSLYPRHSSSDRMDPNPAMQMFSFGMVNQHDALQGGPRWMDTAQNDSSRKLPTAASDHGTLLNEMHSMNLYNPMYSRPHDHTPSEFPVATPSGRQNHAFADEFPHLDIINDLLDDEYVYGNTSGSSMGYQNINNGSHHLNRHLSFPGDPGGMSSGLGLSAGSCRFERTRSYHDEGFQNNYGSALGTSPYDASRDMMPQSNTRPYNLNGQIDNLMPSQWQMPTSDMSYMGVMNAAADNDGYPYHHIPEYANLSVGVNGYTMFRPSNGH